MMNFLGIYFDGLNTIKKAYWDYPTHNITQTDFFVYTKSAPELFHPANKKRLFLGNPCWSQYEAR